MKTAAIIQARMKSTRLPGKVLMPLAGQPLLAHIVARLRRAARIDQIAITTSVEPEDDAIAMLGAQQGVPVFRGAEDDVLGRFSLAAEALEPDIVVRVTGDSPLIDPDFVDLLVGEMVRTNADFLMLDDGVKCIQEGVDPFSAYALDVLMRDAREHPVAREHVTAWLKLHPSRVRTSRISIDPAYEFSGARLSIDTPADARFFEALAARVDIATVSLKEVAALLRREPWLLAINAHVHQKAPSQVAATALLRADGGGRLGYGHLTRAAALAQALREGEGIGVVALTGCHSDGNAREARDFFEARRIPVVVKRPHERETDFISSAVQRSKAKALIVDIRTDLPRGFLDKLRQSGLRIVTIDDASERRLAADIASYPPVPQINELSWRGFTGELLDGPDWTLVGRAGEAPVACSPSRLLVTMGGSDPNGLSLPVAQACAILGLPVDVLLGPGVANARDVADNLGRLPGVRVHVAPENPQAIFAEARLAIASFGVTAYELAHLGVPALYVAMTEDHRRSGQGAAELGFGRIAATLADLDVRALAREAAALFEDPAALQAMSSAGRGAIDGRAAERLAKRVAAIMAADAVPAMHAPERKRRPSLRRVLGG